MPECRSCGAPIAWVLTANGKRMPIDPAPVADGNIEYVGQRDVEREDGSVESVPIVRTLLKGEAESPTLMEPPPRYISHFASCPNAAGHRQSPTAQPVDPPRVQGTQVTRDTAGR